MKVYLEAKPMGRLVSGSDKDKISREELTLQRRWAKTESLVLFFLFSTGHSADSWAFFRFA